MGEPDTVSVEERTRDDYDAAADEEVAEAARHALQTSFDRRSGGTGTG